MLFVVSGCFWVLFVVIGYYYLLYVVIDCYLFFFFFVIHCYCLLLVLLIVFGYYCMLLIVIYDYWLLFVVASEATERAKPATSQASFSKLHTVRKKKRVSRELSVLEIWCIEQKMFVFAYKIDIRGEPARPGPARPDPARPSRSLIAYISGTV